MKLALRDGMSTNMTCSRRMKPNPKHEATMLEEMISETEQYVVEETMTLNLRSFLSLLQAQGGPLQRPSSDSLVLEDRMVPFTPSSEPRPPGDDWGGDDMDDGFEAGGEIDYEDAAVVVRTIRG